MDSGSILILIAAGVAFYHFNPTVKASVDGMLAPGRTFSAASAIAQVTALFKEKVKNQDKTAAQIITWDQLNFQATALEQVATKAELLKLHSGTFRYVPASSKLLPEHQPSEQKDDLPDSITFPVWRIQTQIHYSGDQFTGNQPITIRQIIHVSRTHQMFSGEEPELIVG